MANIKKTDDGYIVRWYWYENGKRRGNHKVFELARDAKAFAADIESRIASGSMADAKGMTVAVYLRQWLDTYNGNVRDNTYSDYKTSIEKHLIPRIGNIKLKSLTTTDIQKAYNDILETEYRPGRRYSAKTVLNIHCCLNKALDKAVQIKPPLLLYNPCKSVEPPSVESCLYVIPEKENIETLLDALKQSRLFYAIIFCAMMGTRRGEALGLFWGDIDFEEKTVFIRRALVYNNKKKIVEIGKLKTKQAERFLPLDDGLIDMLKTWKKEQQLNRMRNADVYKVSDFVFTDEIGNFIHPQRLSDNVKSAAKKAGMEGLRLHDLRHICATYMLDAGISPRTVSEFLGHSTPSFTLKRYAHALDASKRKAAKEMGAVWSPEKKSKKKNPKNCDQSAT